MKMTSVVLASLLFSTQALADCSKAHLPERPEIADGATATEVEMLVSREQVVAYVTGAENYLKCVEPASPFVHNSLVYRIERLAGSFNREREIYLQRKQAVAVN
jgi:hypothetical protein